MYAKIQAVRAALGVLGPVVPGYLNEVNDFPSVAILRPQRRRQHLGAGTILHVLRATVRGYVRTSEDDSIQDTEATCRDIEYVLQHLNNGIDSTDTVLDTALNEALTADQLSLFDDVRVLEVSTDEGLMTPYGVCELEIEASWYE